MEKWTGEIKKTKREIQDRVREYMINEPAKLYSSDIVANDKRCSRENGYTTTDTAEPFCKVIAEYISENAELWKISPDSECTYNLGDRAKKIDELTEKFGKLPTLEKYTEYAKREIKYTESETLLIHCLCCQKKVGRYLAVDYQIPTTNGNADKIDLLLKDVYDNYYMTEAKTFSSDESLLRCVLEIQTYYAKLNYRFFDRYAIVKGKLKKAILIDEKSYAYQQLSTEWGKRLIKKFEVVVFVIEKAKTKYSIKKYK